MCIVGGTDGAGGDSGDSGGRRPGCPGAYGGSGRHGDLAYSGGPDGRVSTDLGGCCSPGRECKSCGPGGCGGPDVPGG